MNPSYLLKLVIHALTEGRNNAQSSYTSLSEGIDDLYHVDPKQIDTDLNDEHRNVLKGIPKDYGIDAYLFVTSGTYSDHQALIEGVEAVKENHQKRIEGVGEEVDIRYEHFPRMTDSLTRFEAEIALHLKESQALVVINYRIDSGGKLPDPDDDSQLRITYFDCRPLDSERIYSLLSTLYSHCAAHVAGGYRNILRRFSGMMVNVREKGLDADKVASEFLSVSNMSLYASLLRAATQLAPSADDRIMADFLAGAAAGLPEHDQYRFLNASYRLSYDVNDDEVMLSLTSDKQHYFIRFDLLSSKVTATGSGEGSVDLASGKINTRIQPLIKELLRRHYMLGQSTGQLLSAAPTTAETHTLE